MSKRYRENGAIGGLLDEYERAVNELVELVESVEEHHLHRVVNPHADKKRFESIAGILSHVISAGYHYNADIRNHLGEKVSLRKEEILKTKSEYINNLHLMFRDCELLFEDYPDIQTFEPEISKKIVTAWKQQYDVEQLYEHAIVHVLRHRRQIERFTLLLRS